MKNKLCCLVILLVLGVWTIADSQPASLKNMQNPEVEKKIDSLLNLMTLEEKIGQLVQYSGSWDLTGPAPQSGREEQKYRNIREGRVGSMLNVVSTEATRKAQKLAVENSRLGIPLIFGYDVIHGYQTMFPVPLGEAASWDLDAIEASARVAAAEAAAAGLHWTFAPMVDVARDARWGRIMEGAGEDTYLGSLVAAARVRGFQGDDLAAENTIAACAKHFAAYGFVEGGREYNTVDISEQTLHNVVLPPFKACVEAGVATFMNAFNEIGGVPATADAKLQRELLKGEWNFQGFVLSDWASIFELIPHGFAANRTEAAYHAITGGSDMDMEGYCYEAGLADLVEKGRIKEALIDDAARRILRLKFHLGLFEDPYRYCDPEREKALLLSEEHLAIARDVACKSIVLLKNEKDILPLAKEGRKIAVIGPLADDKDSPLGSWRAKAIAGSAVSLLEGVKAAVEPGTEVLYAEGVKLSLGERKFTQELTINETDVSGIPAAVEIAKQSDIVLLAIGEDCFQSGEARSRTDIGLPGVQDELFRAVIAANPNVVVVLMNGRPLAIPEVAENAMAIVETWFLGSQAGYAIADVLFGDYNPSGRLPVSFPYVTGQEPLYYNRKNTGRPEKGSDAFWSHYIDAPVEALYPFGYGLSYTTFKYGELRLSAAEMTMDGALEVSVAIENTGERTGKEVVQFYTRDLFGSFTRPIRELKGYQAVELEPGESKTVTFRLTADDLAFYTRNGKWEAEPGEFHVMIGPNAHDLQRASFTLKE